MLLLAKPSQAVSLTQNLAFEPGEVKSEARAEFDRLLVEMPNGGNRARKQGRRWNAARSTRVSWWGQVLESPVAGLQEVRRQMPGEKTTVKPAVNVARGPCEFLDLFVFSGPETIRWR